jgi:flavin-dependent dehydrogenase
MNITIIGNGILANLGALYLRKLLSPSNQIKIIGPDDRAGLPVVGESLIEVTTLFLENQLGLRDYLRDHHLPKYALTYYFKLNPTDATDRTYAVHCNENGPNDVRKLDNWNSPMAYPSSWFINRETFDRDIQKMVTETPGIERIRGHVLDVKLNEGEPHILTIREQNQTIYDIESDWVIDVTGRAQLLARKMNTIIRPEGQRDCFWFRIKKFDRNILKNINALGPMPPGPGEAYHYDRYYSTHHFMGEGHWIWLIPMKDEDGSDRMSIGFVSHPDHFKGHVRNMNEFLSNVDQLHPVIGELVRSGEIVDTQILRKYHYVVDPVYSSNRWAIVGDAAYAPDPLFSNGLAFGTIQWEQIGQMIKMDIQQKLTSDYVKLLKDVLMGPILVTQTAISNWYATMKYPLLSAIRLNWIEISNFYIFLPLVVNRCHYDPERISMWSILQNTSSLKPFEISEEIIRAHAEIDEVKPEHFVYMGKEKVNPRALEKVDDLREILEMGIAGAHVRNRYTEAILNNMRELVAD